jgi:pyruvate/2-oxoglutarate dehydrogenase complex dihydrolipoamide acyltransferase (E2) component
MPQALMWERYGQEIEVALYVRRLAEAEARESSVALSTLVRQLADSLGLSTPGMRANRWRVDRSSEQDEQPAGPSTVPTIAPTSARARLRAVSGGSG